MEAAFVHNQAQTQLCDQEFLTLFTCNEYESFPNLDKTRNRRSTLKTK